MGPGTSGLPQPGATPAAATSPPPAPQRTFEQEFSQRFGVDPQHARTLLTLGYQAFQSAGRQQPPATPAPAATQQEQKNIFGLPQFDRRLLDFVVQGPNGQLELVPGAPPDALYRVQEYREKLKNVQYEFFENPEKFLGELIEKVASKRAEATFEERFGSHQAETTAQQIIRENSGWLFEQDQSGQPLMRFNPATGREERVMSSLGNYYTDCIRQIQQSGVTDIKMQHTLARQMVENAAYRQQTQQSQAPAAGAAAASSFLNRAAAPTVPPPPAPAPAAPNPAVPLTLRQRFEQNFEANGLTDEVVRGQLNSRSRA